MSNVTLISLTILVGTISVYFTFNLTFQVVAAIRGMQQLTYTKKLLLASTSTAAFIVLLQLL